MTLSWQTTVSIV